MRLLGKTSKNACLFFISKFAIISSWLTKLKIREVNVMAKKSIQKINKPKKKKPVTEISRTEVGYDAFDESWKVLGWFLLFVCGLILVCCLDDDTSLSALGVVVITIGIIAGIYFVFLRKKLREKRLERVPKMLPEGIRYRWPFGITKVHSYEEWADSINDGHFVIGPRAFEFRLGIEKLSFYYNVGNAGERIKTEDSYEYFTEKLLSVDPMIGEKLPKYSKSNIDLLDKRCFYHLSRRNQLIVLFCNMLLFLWIGSLGGMEAAILSSLVCGAVESIVFYFLIKGAYYNYKNELACREALPDITGPIKDNGLGAIKPYWGFIYLVIVFVINYLIQYTLIWMK